MKNLLIRIIYCFLIVGVSCKKPEQLPPTANSEFNYTLNGVDYKVSADGEIDEFGRFEIRGFSGENNVFFELINSDIGEHPLNVNSYDVGFIALKGSPFHYYNSNVNTTSGGMITIENINYTDSLISGKFNYTAIYPFDKSRKATITNGTFKNIRFRKVPKTSAANLYAKVSIKVDDMEYKMARIASGSILESTKEFNLYLTHPSDQNLVLHHIPLTLGKTIIKSNYTISSNEPYVGYDSINDTGYFMTFYKPIDASVTITYIDTIANQVKGTFDFYLTNSDSSKNVHLTNGAFELLWKDE